MMCPENERRIMCIADEVKDQWNKYLRIIEDVDSWEKKDISIGTKLKQKTAALESRIRQLSNKEENEER